MQAIGKIGDAICPSQSVKPFGRYAGCTPERAGKLSGNGGGGIRILAQIGSEQHGLTVAASIADRPEGRFEAVDHIARAPDAAPVPADRSIRIAAATRSGPGHERGENLVLPLPRIASAMSPA